MRCYNYDRFLFYFTVGNDNNKISSSFIFANKLNVNNNYIISIL